MHRKRGEIEIEVYWPLGRKKGVLKSENDNYLGTDFEC
jgi:hypothetical protein